MTNIEKFSEELRKEVLTRAANLSGTQVAEALFAVTDEMWAGGVDAAWQRAAVSGDWEMFDLTWLTMLASRLAKLQ